MSQKKKVLFSSHTANFAKFNQPLIKELQEMGYRVDYASAGEEEIPNVDREIKVDFARSPLGFSHHARALKQMTELLENEDYELIHTHTPVGGTLTRLAAKRVRRKNPEAKEPAIIYTAHGFHFYKGGPLINWLVFYPVEKMMAKITDTLITINKEDYRLAKRKMRAKKIERIPGAGVDLTRFKPVTKTRKQEIRRAQGYKKSDFILIYVAELNQNKDQMSIIKQANLLAKEIPHLKILLVGVGPEEEELRAKVHEVSLTETVDFLGYRKDVDELYQMSDIVVSASHREGLGLNLIEGMACGLPAVARNNRGHREIITSSKNGFLFKNGAEMCEAVLKLAKSPERREKIGKNNVVAMQKFAVEKTMAKMREIYQGYLKS